MAGSCDKFVQEFLPKLKGKRIQGFERRLEDNIKNNLRMRGRGIKWFRTERSGGML
jgi:hypothetical protein